ARADADDRAGPLRSARGDRGGDRLPRQPGGVLHHRCDARRRRRLQRMIDGRPAELVLTLLIAVAVLVTIARRLGVAYPIFLVIGGLVLGLIPGTPRVEVDPDLIFLFI